MAQQFYKGFYFPKEDPTMVVNTAGDTFSSTPERAIIYALAQMDRDLVMRMPLATFGIDPEDTLSDLFNNIIDLSDMKAKPDPSLGQVMILRVEANEDTDMDGAVTGNPKEDMAVHLRLKEMQAKGGYKSALCEYTLDEIKIKYASMDSEDFSIVAAKFTIADDTWIDQGFEKAIKISKVKDVKELCGLL